MEQSEWFINELVGKTILVKTQGGVGTKDASLMVGEYKGVLLGFDGVFIRLEYETKKYSGGTNAIFKDTVLINVEYVITVEEFHSKD